MLSVAIIGSNFPTHSCINYSRHTSCYPYFSHTSTAHSNFHHSLFSLSPCVWAMVCVFIVVSSVDWIFDSDDTYVLLPSSWYWVMVANWWIYHVLFHEFSVVLVFGWYECAWWMVDEGYGRDQVWKDLFGTWGLYWEWEDWMTVAYPATKSVISYWNNICSIGLAFSNELRSCTTGPHIQIHSTGNNTEHE